MTVAILTAKLPALTGLGDLFGTIEWLYGLLALSLAVSGPGRISLDHALLKDRI
jgi:uncharacterized membrane protein YphA (DoxX/SURF4 family)